MSSKQPRSIDAPAPPWRLAGADEAQEPTETPADMDTIKVDAAPVVEAGPDKAALAKQLVEQAKAKHAAAAKQKKADLATQLVAEAKKKAANKKKADLAATLVAEAKKKHAAAKKTAPKPKKAPAKKRSLAERTSRPGALSAQDALAAAIAAEAQRDANKPAAKSNKRAKASVKPQPEAMAAKPKPTPKAKAARTANPAEVIAKALPDATVQGDLLPVTNLAVFNALWRANLSRAEHTRDLQGIATANVLLDAVNRLHLVAAKVRHDGTDWAVWVDTSRGAIVAAAAPADVYLAGL